MNNLTYPIRQICIKGVTFSNVVAHKKLFAKHKTILSFNRAVVTLNIKPKISLVDEPIDITISGLEPQQKGEFLNISNTYSKRISFIQDILQ